MEVIFELFFEFFGEIVLQVAFEALAQIGLHGVGQIGKRLRHGGTSQPWLAAPAYAGLGALAGALSLWLMPSLFIASPTARLVNLIVTPVVSGAAMVAIGSLRKRRRGEGALMRIDRFGFAFIFALAMAMVRYRFGA